MGFRLLSPVKRTFSARRVSIYPWVQEGGTESDSNAEFEDSDLEMDILPEENEPVDSVFHEEE